MSSKTELDIGHFMTAQVLSSSKANESQTDHRLSGGAAAVKGLRSRPLDKAHTLRDQQSKSAAVKKDLQYSLEWQACSSVSKLPGEPWPVNTWALKGPHYSLKAKRSDLASLASACLEDVAAICKQERLSHAALRVAQSEGIIHRTPTSHSLGTIGAAAIARVAASEMKQVAWQVCVGDLLNSKSSSLQGDGFGSLSTSGLECLPKIQPSTKLAVRQSAPLAFQLPIMITGGLGGR